MPCVKITQLAEAKTSTSHKRTYEMSDDELSDDMLKKEGITVMLTITLWMVFWDL